MDLHQLRIFVTIADEASITRAAKRLYMTPSTLSSHLYALEVELGVQLFIRSPRGMIITPKGEILREKARDTLAAAHNLTLSAAALQPQLVGTVRIGLCSDPSALKIPDLIAQLQADHIGVRVALHTASSSEILTALSTHRLDVGFVYGSIDDAALISHALAVVELVVAMPIGWADRLQAADWRTLASHSWINVGEDCPFHAVLTAHLNRQRLYLDHTIHSPDDRSRADLVAAGLGLSLIERHAAEHACMAGEIAIGRQAALPCPLHLVYSRAQQHDPLVRGVADAIQALFAA